MRLNNKHLLIGLLFTISLAACKKWEDHIDVANPDLKVDLSQAITETPALSKFREYVSKAGLDSVLTSSKTYTVWAPSNDALTGLDPAIVNDVAKLRMFVLNHISNQSYFSRNGSSTLRVQMLSGKFISFTGTKFDEATLTSADRFVKNGVLHVINKNVLVLPSIWDYVLSTRSQFIQNNFIAGLNFISFDPAQGIVDSINPITGQPIYKPGTGEIERNRFNDRVYDLKAEDKQYTYFVIADAGFTKEADSLKINYATTNPVATDSLAKWNTVKDLAVEGLYPATALTGLLSRSGVPIPIDPSQIIETRKLSNGIVYVLNMVDVITANKYKPVIVQGEFPSGFLSDKRGNVNYRIRANPVTGQDFTDIMITGHGVTAYYSYYTLSQMPSMKYRVYASAINDFQAAAFSQSIVAKYLVSPGIYTVLATLAHAVPLHTATGAYNELLLGDFTSTSFGTLEIQLTATTTGPVVLDYLRIVPLP